MTSREVNREITYWKRLFLFQAWELMVESVREDGLNEDNDAGYITWTWEKMVGYIRIAAKRDAKDVRQTILHEMLHLVLADMLQVYERLVLLLPEGIARDIARANIIDAMERTVNQFQYAFSELRWGNDN